MHNLKFSLSGQKLRLHISLDLAELPVPRTAPPPLILNRQLCLIWTCVIRIFVKPDRLEGPSPFLYI